jgi:hypothetical protein
MPLGEKAINFLAVGSLASNQTLVMNQGIVVDIGTGKVLYKDLLSGNPGKILSFSPDGKFLLTQRVLYGIKR